MPRVYKRKLDPLSQKLTLPVTEALMRKLREYAEQTGRAPTAVAREILERGLAK